jgi:tetratricopeptide (TPR) repeat protein
MKRLCKMPLFAILSLAAVFFCSAAVFTAAGWQNSESKVQAEEAESSPEYIEQYEAWEKASNEPDANKSAAMLIQFLEKYPKSELLRYAENSYSSLLVKCSNERKFQDLETLAEQWLKLRPDSIQTIAYVATASKELGHNEKWTQSLIALYTKMPTGSLANEIAQAYNKAKNKSKYLEWTELALKYPEFETDFRTRLSLVQFFADEKNPAKAVEYAQAAIKAADLVQNPGAETKGQLHTVRIACYDTIGKMLLEQEKYEESIQAFQRAFGLEKSSQSCYFIAHCLRMQKNIDEAMIWYARAEQLGGDYAPKAKENLEQLYKALHNDTLIGIEKIHRKAKTMTDTAEARM